MYTTRKLLLFVTVHFFILTSDAQVFYKYLPLPVFSATHLNIKGNVKSILELDYDTDDINYEHDFSNVSNTKGLLKNSLDFLDNGNLKFHHSVRFDFSARALCDKTEFLYKNGIINYKIHTSWFHDMTKKTVAERSEERSFSRERSDYTNYMDFNTFNTTQGIVDSATFMLTKSMEFDENHKLLSILTTDKTPQVDGSYKVSYLQQNFSYNSNRQVEMISSKRASEIKELKEIKEDTDALYTYNINGDVSKIIYYDAGKKEQTLSFSYTYDKKGNWIKCIIKTKYEYETDNKKYTILARQINYRE